MSFTHRPAAEAEQRTEAKHYLIALGIALAGIAIIVAAHVRFSNSGMVQATTVLSEQATRSPGQGE